MKPKSFEQVLEEVREKPILVANRGIPARRIVRSIQERFDAVGIITATDIDKSSPAASAAQELMLLGENNRAYLDIETIIAKAKRRGVIAIHPGWGFASEDDKFPALCEKAGIAFIGPTAEAMRLLGNKVEVRKLAQRVGVPVVPGSEGSVDIPGARAVAKEMGFPIMLKAEGGGGGRGIYEVYSEEQLEDAFEKASALAAASFGNPRVYVEKLLTSVRHIEIQVIADKYGNVFAFDERDCTVQRNHQKLIEITPSPWSGITPNLRRKLKEYAARLVQEVGYHSLATVEFLVDDDATPYLIEVNTRLQVEHGITEARYGIDLVEEQIAVALGAELRLNDDDTRPLHMAMQVRVNCEDPQKDFEPNAGTVTRYVSPGGPGIRLDSNLSNGYEFPAQYDSAGSLLISYARDWAKLLAKMDRALREYVISGVKTTLPFFKQVIRHPKFQASDYNTKFIERTPELLCYRDVEEESVRLSRLIAEISAKGFNQFVQLGDYRSECTPRLGRIKPVLPSLTDAKKAPVYPRGDRKACLDFVRDSGIIHFSDMTGRDTTQSNSGNRFRLAEDRIVGPYLDNCGFFSLENGGGAHFHVAMLANMTYPFSEAAAWNEFAPKTMKQILIRSTNVLGYKPQPRNVMRATGELVCEHYDVIRCFDFLNHIDNMVPFAEVALNSESNIFEPAISLTYGRGFDVQRYVSVAGEIITMVAKVAGVSEKEAQRIFILGLKDMAGNCPPRFMRELVTALRKAYPELVLHYHRHCTDGLFVPAVAEAARAGAHIVDTGIGSSVRWYGQGDVLATSAYMEDELGLKTRLDKDMIRHANYVLKQVMPYYDRYCAPYFQGVDYDVVQHGMPGGATSSSQEGAMKQGYIHLLPSMLKFLAGTRQVVKYHDVTPGSQITWNTAFLAVTSAHKRGGAKEVQDMLAVLDYVIKTPEEELNDEMRRDRLMLYQDSNDAFRDLLLGKFGKLPLGFPADWVYESAFGSAWKRAIEERTTESPLANLDDIDLAAEESAMMQHTGRKPTHEEFIMYLNHPGDALKTIDFRMKFGDPNNIPLDVWFEGLEKGVELSFSDGSGKPHQMTIIDISPEDVRGNRVVRYMLDSELMSHEVKVGEAQAAGDTGSEMAVPGNESHVGSPCTGDLWITYVDPGDLVKKGEELFNISVMKQEKAVLAPRDGVVRRVLKTANFPENKIMVPVKEGELLIELGPVPRVCGECDKPLPLDNCKFCPSCGAKM